MMKLGLDFGTTRIVAAALDRGNYPIIAFEDCEGAAHEWFPVKRLAGVPEQCIEEKYACNPTGTVEVEISNLTSGYTRRYRLGRWAGKDTPVIPGRKKKSKAEGR